MNLPSRDTIEAAGRIVYEVMPPTPQLTWPLLNQRAGLDLWLKHENHTPVGAFKIRGAVVYFRRLREAGGRPPCVVTATRGNHGQAVALAARREGMEALVYVPEGNSPAKNRAMRGLGATLVEQGSDFEEARRAAQRRAETEGLLYAPSFSEDLLAGVATYSMELLSSVPDLEVLYVPIGLGSGICGAVAAREALGKTTEIVGVVSEHAPAYFDSFAERRLVSRPAGTELADGLACSTPHPGALEIIWQRVARVVKVSDAEVAAAMRALFDDTHNVAEGAGAAAVAAVLKERETLQGRRVAAVVTGGNVDREVFAEILQR